MKAKLLFLFVITSLLFSLGMVSASAAPMAAAAGDGDGLMVVSPTNLTYSGTATTFTFTFTANNDFGAGSQVDLTIPTGWTTPTTAAGLGHVTVSSGTCTLSGSPPYAVTPPDIFVDMTSCTTGQSFTISYNGKAPNATSSPFTFATQTDIGTGGSGLVPITAASPSVTVSPKALTVLSGLTPASKIYDSTTTASLTIGSPTLSGVISGDAVTLVTAGAIGTFSDPNAANNKVVNITGLTLSGAQAGNYSVTQPTRSANITKRSLTITAVSDTKTYDGTTSSSGAPSITNGVVQGGDTEPTWTQAFSNRNTGTGKTLTPTSLVINDGNSGNNYSYTYANVSTGIINKYPITITAITSTKTYDRTTSSAGHPTITSGAIQTGDSEPIWTQTYDNMNVGTNKALTPAGVVLDGNAGNNYSYTRTTDSTGVINAKTLTVSSTGLTPANKIYDGTTSASLTTGSPTLSGIISGDTVTLVTSSKTGTFVDKNVGNGKVVNIWGLTLGGAQGGNYTLTQPTRTANITTRAISVTAATDNKVYDGTTSSSGVPSITSGTIQTGDLEPAWTQTFNNQHAGTGKALTPAGVVNDANGGNNYAYTYVNNNTGVITALHLTVTAITDTKVYDGTTAAGDLPNYSPPLVGSDAPNFSESFDTRNVGTGKTLTPAGVVNDGNSGLDYSYSFTTNTTGVITQLAITVSSRTDNKFYDGTTSSSLAPNITPALGTGDISLFSQTFDSKDIGINKLLTPAGTVNDGNSQANYSISWATDNHGVIQAKPITVTADAKTKVVGDTDPALTFSANPALISPDVFTGQLARTPSGDTAGVYAIIQNTLTAGSNYNITYQSANLLIGWAISGNAGVPNATLSYTDGSAKSSPADTNGNYSFVVSDNWSGTVTPLATGYIFSPASISYSATPVNTSVTNQNYTALVTISGNAGDAAVVIHYNYGGAKTTTSASNGRYSFTVPYNWTGSVTPTKTGVTFTPSSRTYNLIKLNQLNQNYTDKTSFTSTAAYDGTIIETGQNTKVGGSTYPAGTTFYLGDDALNRQCVAIVSFNTGSLPDAAVITKVTLRINKQGLVGTNPFTSLGNILVDIRNGPFSGSAALQSIDFQAAASKSGAGTITNTPLAGNWYQTNLINAALSSVNRAGVTQLRLRFAKNNNNNRIMNYLKFYSGDGTLLYRPTLVIEYHLP